MDAPTRLTNIAEVKERKIQLTLKGIYRLKEGNSNCTLIANGDNATILEFTCIHGLSVDVELIRDVANAVETSNYKQGSVMSCYPNPVNNELFIKNEALIGCIQIFDCEGRLHMAINNPKNPINVDNLLPGIYFLHAEFMGKEQDVLRFVKR